MKRIITMAIILMATGCNTTRDAARSKIEIDVDKLARTGKLEIQSPKDVDLRDIRVVKNGEDYEVSIGQYQAVVSKAAIESARSESEFRAMTWKRVMDSLDLLAEKAAASQGVPQTQNQPGRGNPSFLGVRLMYDQATGYWVEDFNSTPTKPK